MVFVAIYDIVFIGAVGIAVVQTGIIIVGADVLDKVSVGIM